MSINDDRPGLIETDTLEGLMGGREQLQEASAGRQPIGRVGEPVEVAAAGAWPCSPGSSPMTGRYVVLDGGMTATA